MHSGRASVNKKHPFLHVDRALINRKHPLVHPGRASVHGCKVGMGLQLRDWSSASGLCRRTNLEPIVVQHEEALLG
eukprot:scaffold51242_cov21-Tisochrysis_lutea.AAC.3